MIDEPESSPHGEAASPRPTFDEELMLRLQSNSWRNGQGLMVEQLLAENYAGSTADIPADDLMLLICGEIAQRRARGQRAMLKEYQHRFPSLTDALATQWQIDRWLDGESTLLVGGDTGSMGSEPSLVQGPLPVRPGSGSEPQSNAQVPTRIGRYEIRHELGHGAMGVVYLAWDPKLGRHVAIKRLGASFIGTTEGAARLRLEAKAVARLDHPHIVKIFDVGEHDEMPFLAIELCRGGTLGQRLNGRPLSHSLATQLMLTIAEAVAEAHCKRIIHRDLKPGNILLDHPEQWNPKVSDFGLAKWLDSDGNQTASGAIIGTPAYMAPEQARGDVAAVAETTDVYALGAILYECLTGRAPFTGESVGKLLEQVARVEPLSVRRLEPSVPQDLETIVQKCMRKEAGDRYADARELADDLRRFVEHRPILARRPSRVTIARHWCHRNPAVAGLCTTVCLLVLASLSVLGWMNYRLVRESEEKSHAMHNLTTALNDKQLLFAKNEEMLSAASRNEAVTRQRYYNSQVSLSGQALLRGNVARTEDLLDSISGPEWQHLKGFEYEWLRKSLYKNLLVQFTGIAGEITSLDFSPHGGSLLAAGGDQESGFISLLDLESGKIVNTRKVSSMVNGVKYSPDGALAVFVAGSGGISVCDPATLETSRFVDTNLHCKSLGWIGKADHFAVGTEDGYLSLWSSNGPTLLDKVKAHQGPILRVFPARDAEHIFTSVDWGGEGRCSSQWLCRDGKLKQVDRFQDISLCDESPDGQFVVGVAWGDIVVRDKRSGDNRSHVLSTGPMVTVQYDRDGTSLIASPRNDRELKTLSAESLVVLDRRPARSPINAVARDEERGLWAIGDSHGSVRVWRKETSEMGALADLDMTCTYVACLKGSHDVLVGSTSGTWRWNPLTGQLTNQHAASHVRAASRDGGTLVSYTPTTAAQSTLEIWKLGEPISRRLELPYAIYQDCLHVSPNGGWLATRGEGTPVSLIALKDASVSEKRFEGNCFSLAISHDEKLLLGGAQFGRVPLYSLADGSSSSLTADFESMWAWGMKTAFSPDGQYMACGNESGLVRVWKRDTLELVAQLSGHEGEIRSLAFFPDGRRLLVAGAGNPRLWDFVAAQELLELPLDGGRAQMLDVSSDGTLIVALTTDAKVLTWTSQTTEN